MEDEPFLTGSSPISADSIKRLHKDKGEDADAGGSAPRTPRDLPHRATGKQSVRRRRAPARARGSTAALILPFRRCLYDRLQSLLDAGGPTR